MLNGYEKITHKYNTLIGRRDVCLWKWTSERCQLMSVTEKGWKVGVQLPRAAVTNYHKLHGLKQQVYSLSVLEVRSLKSGWRQVLAPSDGSREGSFFGHVQHLVVAGYPWHSLVCGFITPVSAAVLAWSPPLCICFFVSKSPSFKGIGPTGVRACPNLLQLHLDLTTSTKTHLPNKVIFTVSKWTLFSQDSGSYEIRKW